jgi:hypothetical protein
MAIGAPHVAFRDFGEELITPAPRAKKSDVVEFFHAVSVIELEDERVTLATIHAIVRP